MLLKKLTLFCCLFISLQAISQTTTISGTLDDSTAQRKVSNAVVALMERKDSTLVSFVRTKVDGNFLLNVKMAGDYILLILHPQFADYVEDITIGKADIQLAKISLTSKSKLLETVVLNSVSSIRVKGDTTIYTADSFKVSANANVEELLKKLPGIQVDKNGKITALGQSVEKVLVDGEEFFGDDPGMAVKNLRADAVKEVQVFDKKSDQATFTGIDDGNTKKTINLKLKDNKKSGYFGKIDLSGGPLKNRDDRYNNNILYSNFKGKRKLSAFVLNGNTGQDGLSWRDSDQYGGNDNMSMEVDEENGNTFFSRSSGGNDDEPYVDTENGFTTNVNAGLQYSNKWNAKKSLNLSPKFNSQIYDNDIRSFVQTQLQNDSVLNNNNATSSHINRNNIKLSGIYEIKLDSNNSIKITARQNFYNIESDENSTSETTGKNGNLKNSVARMFRLESEKQAMGGSILFKRKFAKPRRTISLNTDFANIESNGQNFLQTVNNDFIAGTTLPVNQQFDNNRTSNNFTAAIVYTEPLGKKYALLLGHEVKLIKGSNNQNAYSFTQSTGKYDQTVDSLTNNFDQQIIVQQPSAKISYNHKKIKVNAGSGFGITKFDFLDKTFNKDYNRKFTNIFPTAGFNYTYKPNHTINVTYRGATRQPTLLQLQPLRNNNDQFNQYIGNPDLKQSFTNTVDISHNSYNFIKDVWSYASLNASSVSNAITNIRNIDAASGKITFQPVNTNGNLNVGLWSGIGFKAKKINTRFQLSPSLNYSKFADIINNQISFSETLSSSLGFYANKGKEKKYDFSVNSNFGFNRNTNAQIIGANSFRTLRSGLSGLVYLKKVWSIEFDYAYQARQKTLQLSEDLNFQLLNAKIQRTFAKDVFTVYIIARDILNQNIGISQNFYGNTYSQTINDRLQRYFLLGFRWDFKTKAEIKK